MKIGVIGAGSFGTALSLVLLENGHDVTLWVRREEQRLAILKDQENKTYLPGIKIPTSLHLTGDLKEAVQDAELLLTVVPSQTLRENLTKIKPHLSDKTLVVNASKGIEEGTKKLMNEVIEEVLEIHGDRIAVLSGPSHAEELAQKMPTTCVVASTSIETAKKVQDGFMSPYFRIYTNPDVVGVEIGGALKNVIALGAGICEGLGLGDNARAALMTRGIIEIMGLGLKMGAKGETFLGLAGVGDLIVTCTSPHSRNKKAGLRIGRGESVSEAASGNMVVEGIRTTIAAYELGQKYQVDLPITEAIYEVVQNHMTPEDMVKSLMEREKTQEIKYTFHKF